MQQHGQANAHGGAVDGSDQRRLGVADTIQEACNRRFARGALGIGGKVGQVVARGEHVAFAGDDDGADGLFGIAIGDGDGTLVALDVESGTGAKMAARWRPDRTRRRHAR